VVAVAYVRTSADLSFRRYTAFWMQLLGRWFSRSAKNRSSYRDPKESRDGACGKASVRHFSFSITYSRGNANLIAVRLPWRRVGVRRQVAKTPLQYWPIQ
jgi:hypothetical protein